MKGNMSMQYHKTQEYLQTSGEFRVETYVSGKNVKWSLFKEGKRGSIGKVIVQLRPCCDFHFAQHNELIGNVDVESKVSEQHSTAVSFSRCEEEPFVFLENVFVDRKFRGRNLATLMLKHCADYFFRLNQVHWFYQYIELEAEEDMDQFGKLVDLYLRNRYQVFRNSHAKEFKVLYNGDQTFRVVPMRKYLFKPVSLNAYKIASGLRSCPETKQSIDMVSRLRIETCKNNRLRMTMLEAMQFVNECYPGTLEKASRVSKVLREEGHPEWLQTVGFILSVGLLQNRLIWQMSFEDKKDIGSGFLPEWAHEDFSSLWKIDYESGSGLAPEMIWSCYEYLFTVLTGVRKNRKALSIPEEGLFAIRYFKVNYTQPEVSDQAKEVQFWVQTLRNADEKAEKELKTVQVHEPAQVSKVDEQLLTRFCPDIIAW
mmetsp:Transcript_7177/g.9349  ORF Transcript_7177/g.9349 Transcript_7177/m.9349 type:complete len:427 (+) Transcript_7177:375-1655(+)